MLDELSEIEPGVELSLRFSRIALTAVWSGVSASNRSNQLGRLGARPEQLRFNWCRHEESNPGHPAYKAGALSAEL